jgi:Uma2 family endonuclease
MGMPHSATGWTAAMLTEMPDDGRRYEVVDGELLVTPSPAWRHQTAIGLLHIRLGTYLANEPVGHVIIAPADVMLDSRSLVQPDLFVAPLVNGRKPVNFDEAGSLLLAVEVLSPSSARADRHIKRRRYQRAGIAEYWIVDLDARLIERWRPDDERPEVLADELVWKPAGGSAPLRLELPMLFADVDS